MDPLIFIDTNILLDFYRIRRGDVGLSLLERFDNHHGEIITGSQVEMEFKRNRQIEIIRQLSDFKKGSSGNSSLPAILSETQLGKTYKKKQKDPASNFDCFVFNQHEFNSSILARSAMRR